MRGPVNSFAVLLGISLLAGCGGQAAPGNPTSGSSAGTSSATSPAAAANSLDQLAEAARKEGNITVYASVGTTYRQMDVDAFQQAFPGMTVDAIFVSSAERMSRINLERQAGKYLADVTISGTSDLVTTLKDANILQPLKPFLALPEVTTEANWLQSKLWWSDSAEPYTTLEFEGNVNPIMFVNPKLVDPNQFKSYWDLLDPKWKGKMVSTDIRNPGKGADPARFTYKNPDLGAPFLTRLFSETNVKLSDDQTQMVNWVAQGTYPIGLFLSTTEALLGKKQGLDIVPVPPEQFKEGADLGPGAGAVAVFDKAPHPNAAKLYVNWLLSKQGQMTWQRIIGDPSLRIDIPKDGLEPSVVPKPDVKYTATGTEEYGRLQSSVMRKLIDDAVNKQKG